MYPQIAHFTSMTSLPVSWGWILNVGWVWISREHVFYHQDPPSSLEGKERSCCYAGKAINNLFLPASYKLPRSLQVNLLFLLLSHSLKLAPKLAGNGLLLQPCSWKIAAILVTTITATQNATVILQNCLMTIYTHFIVRARREAPSENTIWHVGVKLVHCRYMIQEVQ